MKKMNLFVFSLFALLLVMSSVSALTVIGGEFDLSKDNMTITITANATDTFTSITLTDSNEFDITISEDNFIFNSSSSVKTILITLNEDKNTFDLGTDYINTITAKASDGSVNATGTVTITPTLCEDIANEGILEITGIEFDVKEGFGGEDDSWYLFDEIEVEIDIDNKGSSDIQNVEIEWELYSGSKKIMDGTENDFDLDEDEDNTITFTFRLDEDVDDFDSGDATLYVKATGEVDDKDSDYDGDDTCAADFREADVVTSDDFMVLNNVKLNDELLDGLMLESSTIQCGNEVILTSEVWNIGEDDQEDVYVNIYNKFLGINEDVTLGDVDGFENAEFTFTFDVPKDLDEKWYTLEVEIRDEDRDLFENGEDDESMFDVVFKVEGNCKIQAPQLSAVLDSEAIEGNELLIKAVLTNLEDKTVTYNIVVDGYNSWAELKDLDREVIVLTEGQSQEINIKLDTNKDAEGSQSMKISIFSNGELALEQPLSVNVEEGKFNLGDFLSSNWKLIGLIVLILVLVIAIVAIVKRR